jgi:hypothetical protein
VVPELQTRIANAAQDLAANLFAVAKNHLTQFPTVEGTWISYLNQCGEFLATFQYAHKLSPKNTAILKNIVVVTKDNIEGFAYAPAGSSLPTARHSVSDQYELTLRQIHTEAVQKIQQLDPAFTPLPIHKPGCVLVLAAGTGGLTFLAWVVLHSL